MYGTLSPPYFRRNITLDEMKLKTKCYFRPNVILEQMILDQMLLQTKSYFKPNFILHQKLLQTKYYFTPKVTLDQKLLQTKNCFRRNVIQTKCIPYTKKIQTISNLDKTSLKLKWIRQNVTEPEEKIHLAYRPGLPYIFCNYTVQLALPSENSARDLE